MLDEIKVLVEQEMVWFGLVRRAWELRGRSCLAERRVYPATALSVHYVLFLSALQEVYMR